MTEGEIVELAERCEAAAGPDRELDQSIHAAVGSWVPLRTLANARLIDQPEIVGDRRSTGAEYVSFFTASLDAALALVPEGLGYSICPTSVLLTRSIGDAGFMGRAATPALALCAAALRARAHTERKG